MIRKLLLIVLFGLYSGYATFAQDPFVSIPVIAPASLSPGQTAIVTAPFGNASINPILVDDADHLVYTVILFPYSCIRATGFSLTVPTGATYTPDNLTVTSDTVDIPFDISSGNLSGTATRFTIKQKDISLPIPGNATYNLVISTIAIAPLSFGAYQSSTALSTGISTNNPSNDSGYSSFRIIGPMPVSLVSFTAKSQGDHNVELAWITSLETNNKGFLVERSNDLKIFVKVGEVTEVGANSSALKNYHLTDFTPFQGTSYYRLTQMDLDGKSTVFPVVSVVLREGTYGVFPNPVLNGQQFRLSLDEPETAQVTFYGADGRVMPVQKMDVESGSLLLKVTGKLSTGVYILTVSERGQTRKHRLVVE